MRHFLSRSIPLRASPLAKSRYFSELPLKLSSMAPAQVNSLPQFVVGVENGFLPRAPPLECLPKEFDKLESLLQRMPVKTHKGEVGLLATGDFGPAVLKELPDYSDQISKITDTALLTALFRDYTFATSAYLLEPCDIEYRKSKTYGLGRDVLPKNLAVPLSIIAKKIGAKPFMEYALSYALYNYAKVDNSKPLDYDNLRLIRLFDGSPAEHGFILVHVAMVRYSGDLVKAAGEVLTAASNKDRYNFNKAMTDLLNTHTKINQAMETMWGRSKPDGYQGLRTFIMGTKNQPMFPNGVLYEGVSDERTQYRGESGANDSMIPTLDNLLQVTENLPVNPLTDVLRDFRTYRPPHHNEWLNYVEDNAKKANVRGFALQNPESGLLYIQNLDLIREFRLRHWKFTKEYIMKYSKHPVATGGSPITTWLPNQLSAVMGILVDSCEKINRNQLSTDKSREDFDIIKNRATSQKATLDAEVETLRKEYGQ